MVMEMVSDGYPCNEKTLHMLHIDEGTVSIQLSLVVTKIASRAANLSENTPRPISSFHQHGLINKIVKKRGWCYVA